MQSQASARARRKALSRALRVSVAAAVNSERASASRPARNRESPLAAAIEIDHGRGTAGAGWPITTYVTTAVQNADIRIVYS